jgi:hypothetical protein
MFGFGKKPSSDRVEDKIWAERLRKYDGILQDCEDLINENHLVLIVYHFDHTRDELQTLLHNRKRSYTDFKSVLDVSKWIDGYFSNSICMIDSERIVNSITENDPPITTDKKPYVIVAEHYPRYERDEDVLAWTNRINPCSICFYESMDADLLKPFGSDKIMELLERMNWDTSTFMSHSFITKSIENAQKTISEKATGDVRAASAELWFEYNYVLPQS